MEGKKKKKFSQFSRLMGWLRVRRIRKGWAKADSLGQVIRGLRGPAKKGRLWQWLREPPWVSKPEVSLLHLLEGCSGGRDSLRQGGGQGALQPSCDRDPTRVTAVRVGKRARSPHSPSQRERSLWSTSPCSGLEQRFEPMAPPSWWGASRLRGWGLGDEQWSVAWREGGGVLLD